MKEWLESLRPEHRRVAEILSAGWDEAQAHEREACAAICDGMAEVNRQEAIRRGEWLGREAAGKDEKCASLWATFHAARELAATIRARQ